MVTVEIFEDEKKIIRGFMVEGHSGFAPSGKDIVCAAISILTQTAVLGLTDYLHLNPEITIETGVMKCFLPKQLTEKQLLLTQTILQTMLLGLKATEQSYGKYLSIHKRRWA